MTGQHSCFKNRTIYSLAFGGLIFLCACSATPYRAEKLDTRMDKTDSISGEQKIGIKDGSMVFQKKVNMSEEIRRLQNDVYSEEYQVYGNKQYGSVGLYGVLKECRSKVSDKANGGDGKIIWTEPIERVTETDDEFKLGIDENEKLVGVKEEYLRDRINRLRGFKSTLERRQEEYEEKISICKAELKSRQQALGISDDKSGNRAVSSENK